jgi:large subunit ribosomal protein L44e
MKMEKELHKFCPRCKTHTTQVVSIYKKGKDRKVAEGARRHAEDKKGYGGQKFPELKRTAKTVKEGIRMRKLEIQA